MDIDWDPAKNRSNERKHGITFQDAQAVFQDTDRVDDLDDGDYGEERWITIGMVGSVILYVVYTNRESGIRLISARKANRREQARYLFKNYWG